jgi:lysophospholipase L1-like esterase
VKLGAICLIIFCALVTGLVWGPVAGAASFSWSDGSPAVYKSEPTTVEVQPDCSTYVQKLQVEGLSGEQSVCVLGGGGFKIGSFRDDGTSRAVVMYPLDSEFHILSGVCDGLAGCLYSPEQDVLVSRYGNGVRVYGGVRSRIHQTVGLGLSAIRYDFDISDPLYSTPSGIPVGAFALSRNGKWLGMEIKNLGIGLVNLETGTARRVMAPGYQYGRGFDPSEELAVSNDGSSVVVMGDNAGITFASIDSDCGDILESPLEPDFAFGVKACHRVAIDASAFIPSFAVGLSPHFDDTGGQLEFVAGSRGFGQRRVVLRANGFDGAPELGYLALGDSFSSGEGETDDHYYEQGTDDKFEECHVSVRSYPFLLAAAMQLTSSAFQSVACSGAKTTDILGQSGDYWGQEARLGPLGLNLPLPDRQNTQANSLLGFLPGRSLQEAFVQRYQPEVVSVGIGGNDAGFMDKLKACAMPGTCEWAATTSGRYSIGLEIHGLFGKLVNLYEQLKLDAPFSHFYAVGYPQIMSPTGVCDLLTATLFDTSERSLVEEGISYLNQVIKAAAGAAKISYLDIEQTLAGRELCGSSGLPSAVNGLRFGNDIAPTELLPMLKLFGKESFHPNPTGHELIARTILRQQPDLRVGGACDTCATSGEPPPIPDSLNSADTTLRGTPSNTDLVSSAEIARRSSTVSLSLPAGSLEPGSIAQLEVHSDPLKLGLFSAATDGSLVGEAHLPPTLGEGFHTLHLYGNSFSGQPVDLYQVILLRDQVAAEQVNIVDGPRSAAQVVAPTSSQSAVLSLTHTNNMTPVSHDVVTRAAWRTLLHVVGGCVGGVGALIGILRWRARHISWQDRGG